MNGDRRHVRLVTKGMVAALLGSAATTAYAQQSPEPLPPPPNTTLVVEQPVAADPATPDPQSDQPKPDEPKLPEKVPRDASGIDLSTLETKNVSILYFDPVQTYLTPYIARAFENALIFHQKTFNWTPWDRTTLLLKDFGDY
ncbi:MAG TPA: hypothetical protein VGR05_01740, partial [Sphingomicrobium sp.]|nr:hypothetical protein [Sphingomicrobium sp.]